MGGWWAVPPACTALRCSVAANGVPVLRPLLQMLWFGQSEVADEDNHEHDDQHDYERDHQHPPHVDNPLEGILKRL